MDAVISYRMEIVPVAAGVIRLGAKDAYTYYDPVVSLIAGTIVMTP